MRTAEPTFELFLNYACTAKCPFCYNPPLTPELLRRDLDFDQAARALYLAAKGPAKLLNLHGGEVTLRDDLPKILALARKLGFAQVTLITNGVRLGDPGYARQLVESGATHFRLSVHAASAPLHDRIVAIPGAFDKVLAAIGHLRALKAPLGLNFVLIRSNAAELPAFVRRFVVKEGVGDLIVYFPHRRGMMDLNYAAEGISYAEVAAPVREAAALGRDSILLANFVPCVLPELKDRMLDWGEEHAGSGMIHPEGKETDIHEMKARQRAPVAACSRCALARVCHGVEREYSAARGEAEFTPLEAAPA